tara:strand:- start:549 stop:812 length:264 start_codon:yes stop_codon:yes gene_type:complete
MTERGTDEDKEGQTRTKSDRQEQRVTDRHKKGRHDMVMAEGETDKAKEGHTATRWVVKGLVMTEAGSDKDKERQIRIKRDRQGQGAL